MLLTAILTFFIQVMNAPFALVPDPPNMATFDVDPDLLSDTTVFGAGPTDPNPIAIVFSTIGALNNFLPVDWFGICLMIILGVRGVCLVVSVVRLGLRAVPTVNLGGK